MTPDQVQRWGMVVGSLITGVGLALIGLVYGWLRRRQAIRHDDDNTKEARRLAREKADFERKKEEQDRWCAQYEAVIAHWKKSDAEKGVTITELQKTITARTDRRLKDLETIQELRESVATLRMQCNAQKQELEALRGVSRERDEGCEDNRVKDRK